MVATENLQNNLEPFCPETMAATAWWANNLETLLKGDDKTLSSEDAKRLEIFKEKLPKEIQSHIDTHGFNFSLISIHDYYPTITTDFQLTTTELLWAEGNIGIPSYHLAMHISKGHVLINTEGESKIIYDAEANKLSDLNNTHDGKLSAY
ncbi:MAG: hypothetical protein LBN07_04510 [Christensenellaceae bacterium]|jgi:hypothetical protein|nr:hypothetical protein [Christensenellaceae bacterium]